MAERAGRRALARVGHGRLRRRSRLALAEPAGELGAESSDEGKDPTVRSGGRRRGDWACAGERPQVAGNGRRTLVSLNAVVDRSAAGAEGDRKTRAGHAVVGDAIAGEGERRDHGGRGSEQEQLPPGAISGLLFLSTTMIARTQMPGWMQTAAKFNPVDWGVKAAREVVLPNTALGLDRLAPPAAARTVCADRLVGDLDVQGVPALSLSSGTSASPSSSITPSETVTRSRPWFFDA